ncbi:hypothetical protein L484_016907 [Morus notabilis]|uniref:MD-2-related lipid-recognition domain-containing protein n=1 Tax=Morus notabilis TaxID=981085 RepID=W9SK24_9ROSA|nr:hypothetical protein L484_016907 [Morus notabilis]
MAEMKLIAVLLIPLLCLIVPLTQAVNFHYCDKQADYDVFVQGVEINPHPVIRSQLATFTVNAYTGEAISGGKLVIDIKYFGVHIHQETHELCGETSCPVSAGSFVISHTEALPAFTPPPQPFLFRSLRRSPSTNSDLSPFLRLPFEY